MTPNHEYAFYAALGERLRASRMKHGLTQIQLAERLRVTSKSVSQWESATHRMSLFTYERLRTQIVGFR